MGTKNTATTSAFYPTLEEIKQRKETALRRSERLSNSPRNHKIRDRVAAATVKLAKLGGQGVLIPGGYILTAAHCIDWSGTGAMALGEFFVEPIKTRDGRKLLANVDAAEPVADIAVLGTMDGQVSIEDADAFESFAESIAGVPLSTDVPNVNEFIPVQILTHTGRWITGVVARYGFPGSPPGAKLCLHANERIRGGTSGSPVVDFSGKLIGVVSHSAISHDGTFDGLIPLAYLALPRWFTDRVVPQANGRKRPRSWQGQGNTD